MARTKSLEKKECQKIHFRGRMRSRFGINLSHADYENIVQAIQNSRLVKMNVRGTDLMFMPVYQGKQNSRVSIYTLVNADNGIRIPVVYDKTRHTLVTAHNGLTERINYN